MTDTSEFKMTPLDTGDLEALQAEAGRVLAQTEGEIRLPGLDDSVEVRRDKWGVPHINADSVEALFFAQGFVTAQDRLWQMEVRRRLEGGRLSEAFGVASLNIDKFTRTIGLKRHVEAEYDTLDTELKGILKAYCDGVNAFIETHADRLPIEYSLAMLTPEPWQPLDLIGKGMAYQQGGIFPGKVLRARIVEHLGADRARDAFPTDPDVPIDVPDGVDYSWLSTQAVAGAMRFVGMPDQVIDSSYIGSNSWAVDAFASKTGGPLHCSDPHLAVSHPSTWYEIHLRGAGFDVIGCSAPGTPGVVIGHNADMAWGMTNASADIQDVFIEELDPSDPTRYRRGNGWEALEIESHEIPVRFQPEPERLDVKVTTHGPVVYESDDGRYGLSVSWTATDRDSMFTAVLHFNRAKNVEEFEKIVESQWCAPPMNFVFADRSGRIRRVSAGRFPVRGKGSGLVPMPGWDPDYDWKGLTGPDALPRASGSPNHVIVSANDRTTTDTSPHLVSHEWDPGFRAGRILSYLAERRKVGVEEMAELQNDVRSLPAPEFVGYLTALTPEAEDEKIGLELLASWDMNLDRDSAAAAVYEVTLRKAVLGLFAERLGNEIMANWLESQRLALITLLERLARPDDYWFGHLGSDPVAARDALLRQALRDAVAELREKLGPEPSGWRWGALHTIYFKHGASRSDALKKLLDVGPFEMGGDSFTVNNTGQVMRFGYRQLACASYRHICDLADWDNSRSVHTLGQSGQPESPHFSDLAPLYVNGDYHQMAFSPEAVDQVTEATLRLLPGN